MNRLLLFLTCLAGLVSCAVCVSPREYLIIRLQNCKVKVESEIRYYKEHGFNHQVHTLENMLTAIDFQMEFVQELNDQATNASAIIANIENIEKTTEQIKQKSVDPQEDIKFLSLYTAALNDLKPNVSVPEYSERMVEKVKKVVRINATPSNWHEVEKAYAELEKSIVGNSTFKEFYVFVNGTTSQLSLFMKSNRVEKKVLKEWGEKLSEYDSITLLMAQKFPINSEQKVDEFYELARKHVKLAHEIKVFNSANPIKKELLIHLDEAETLSKKAIKNYEDRQFNSYFTRPLTQLILRIGSIRKNVHRLPDNADQNEAFLMIQEVKDIDYIVPRLISNPAPDESFKALSLYFAAMQIVDESSFNASAFLNLFEKIIVHESELAKLPDVSSFDKIARQAASKVIRQMYGQLGSMVNLTQVPTPEDDVKLEKNAEIKIRELIAHNMIAEADKWGIELNNFHKQTRLLNSLLPINSTTKTAEFFKASKYHYRLAKKLEELLKIDLSKPIKNIH